MGKRLDDLLGRPRGRGMLRHSEVNDAPTVMRQHHEHEEHAASDGGGRRRRRSRETVRSEMSMPSLPNSPWTRGAPQGIRRAHLFDERPNGHCRAGASGPGVRGSVESIAVEASVDATARQYLAAR